MKNLLGLSLFSLVLVTACGGKGKPLTPEQKENWIQLNASAGRTQTAAQDAGRGQARARAFRLSDEYLLDDPIPSPATGASIQGGSEEMIRALSQGNCEFSGPNVSGGSGGFGMNLSVSGVACPISMRLMMAMNFDPSGSGSFDMDVDYRVVSDEFRRLNDVTAMTLSGGFTFQASQTAATFGGTIKGAIQSTKHGVVPIRMIMDGGAAQSGAHFSYKMIWTIKGDDVILLAEGTQSGITYSLNTEPLDQDEFQAYLAQGGPMAAKAFQARSSGGF